MKINDLKGLYIAHRGIQTDKTIENTLPAFSLAIDKKIPIEIDLHILKDKNIVVYHDNNLKRLMNIDRKLSSYTYNELKQLTFPNTDIHIPKLEDVLNFVHGKVLLIIEIKKCDTYYKEYCRKIVSILKKYKYDFVIKSFDIRIVKWFLKNTDYITGLLIANRKKNIYDLIIMQKITFSIIKPNFLSVDSHIIEKKIIQNYRKKKPVLVWTINNLDTLNKVKDKADSFLIEKFYF